MKIQIDTNRKVIKIEESSVNVDDLFTLIKKLLPEDWGKYKLEGLIINNWVNPIIITQPLSPPLNPYPRWQNPIIYNNDNKLLYGSTTDFNANGIYNLEINLINKNLTT